MSSSGLSISSAQESSLVGGSGFNIGALNAGWPSQGGIVAKFQVSNNQNINCPSGTHLEGTNCVPDTVQGQQPSVTTYAATGLSDTSGSVTLKGFVNPNQSATTVWFQYRKGNGSWTDTSHQSIGTSAQNISKSLTGLSGGNYEYQTVGQNQYGTIYGDSKFFTLNGGGGCTTCDCNGGCGTEDPSVTTYTATGVSDSSGTATLRGFVDPNNGSSVTAWFRYSQDNGSWIETSHQSISGAQNISKNLTGLASGDYDFQAAARSQGGTTIYGDTKSFSINGNDNCNSCSCNDNCGNNTNDPSVETLSATNIDDNSATLRGNLTDDGNDSNDVYFTWGTSSNNLNRTLTAGTKSSTGTFSKNLSGLNDNTTYYYKACADNSSGSDCGSTESFRTDSNGGNCTDCCDNCNGTSRPDVTTLTSTSVGSTVAIINGYYNSNGCSTTTYFQYGRTNDLGSFVGSVSHSGDTSGGMAYVFSSLSPSTTYYYRAVGSNCEGVTYGAIKSFTTNTQTVFVDNTPVVTIGGTGNQFIKLMIDNHRGTVRSGTDIAYDVSWENITGTTLKNLVLQVNFDQMTVVDTDMGNIAHDASSVIIEISTLDGHETGEATIVARTKGILKDGDPIVAQAIMAFENPKTSATENAIAYDSDQFTTRGSVLGASIFGLGLPTSLGGWLIILLIILLIIVLARHFMRQNQNHIIVNQAPAPHPVDVVASPATGNDYIVYRPTPPIK